MKILQGFVEVIDDGIKPIDGDCVGKQFGYLTLARFTKDSRKVPEHLLPESRILLMEHKYPPPLLSLIFVFRLILG